MLGILNKVIVTVVEVIQGMFEIPIFTTVEVLRCLWTPAAGLGSSDTVILTVWEFRQASFSTKNVLKLNFHNFRGFLMLVDSCFSAGKIR